MALKKVVKRATQVSRKVTPKKSDGYVEDYAEQCGHPLEWYAQQRELEQKRQAAR